MSHPDDYQDEMFGLFAPRDEDVERALAGEAPMDEGLAEVADVLARGRAALAQAPPEAVQARHLAAVAEAARGLREQAQRARMPARAGRARPTRREGPMRNPLVRRTAQALAAAAVLVLATAGLAVAGVDLPGTAAETAFEKVFGVTLPNQGAEVSETGVPEELPEEASDTADRVLEVILARRSGEATAQAWSGCEFGAHVAAAARGEATADTSNCASATAAQAAAGGGQAAGAPQGSTATGDEASGGTSAEATPPVEVPGQPAGAPPGQEVAEAARTGAGQP